MSDAVTELVGTLSIDEYYAMKRSLGLRHKGPGDLHLCIVNMEHYDVPDPSDYTPEHRAIIMNLLKLKIRGF